MRLAGEDAAALMTRSRICACFVCVVEGVRGSVKVPPRQEFGGGCVPEGLK